MTDKSFVETTRKVDARQVELPIYQAVMDRIGKPVVFNIGVLGALPALKPLVQRASILKILEQKFPAALFAMNKQALEVGYDLGVKLKT